MQIASYEEKAFRRAYNTHADFTSEKKVRICILVCNILDMIHSSNSVLWSGGWRSGVYFFREEICDIVFGLFDTKIKQNMIPTDRVSIPSLK